MGPTLPTYYNEYTDHDIHALTDHLNFFHNIDIGLFVSNESPVWYEPYQYYTVMLLWNMETPLLYDGSFSNDKNGLKGI